MGQSTIEGEIGNDEDRHAKSNHGLAVALALSASLAATATEASAQQTSAGSAAVGNNYHMRNVTTNKCADVQNGSVDTGAIVHQWECADLDSQRWAPVDAGNGFMTLHNQKSGWCMAVKNNADFNGTQIIQTVCNAADPASNGARSCWTFQGPPTWSRR